MIKYIKEWINVLLFWIRVQKQLKKEDNCKKGIHSWRKNPNWYQTDKHGNHVFYGKQEFRDFPSLCIEVYYMQCECCGHKKVTREKINYD
jgi:hypothetical protein